jgi:hypothetical protein
VNYLEQGVQPAQPFEPHVHQHAQGAEGRKDCDRQPQSAKKKNEEATNFQAGILYRSILKRGAAQLACAWSAKMEQLGWLAI